MELGTLGKIAIVGGVAYAGYSVYNLKNKIKVGDPKLGRNPIIQLTGAKVFIQLPFMNASTAEFVYKGLFVDVFLLQKNKSPVKIGGLNDPSANVVLKGRATTNIDLTLEVSFLAIAPTIVKYIIANGFNYKKDLGLQIKGSVFTNLATIPLDVKI